MFVPHIVLDRNLDLNDFSILFKPLFQKSPLIKIHEMYVESKGTNALFSTVVIDESHHDFFIQVMSNKDRTTIRLLPATDPKKTDSIKQSLANLCLEIQTHYPEMKVIKSNLWNYLKPLIVND